jgi:hypothetical protein
MALMATYPAAPAELAVPRVPAERRSTVALFMITAFIALTVLYPFFLYEQGIDAALNEFSVGVFWLHAAICAVGLFLAVFLRTIAFTSVQLFHWMFFVVAAREQFIHEWDNIFKASTIAEKALLYLLIYELVILFVFLSMTWANARRSGKQPAGRRRDGTAQSVTAAEPDGPTRRLAGSPRILIILLICLTADILLIAWFGGTLFQNRENFSNRAAALFPAQSVLIFLQYFRPLLYFIPLFILRSQITGHEPRRDPLPWPIIGLALLCTMLGYLFNSPVCAPRFHAGAMLVGTVMLFVGPRRLAVLIGVLIVGIAIAPIFGQFRNDYTLNDGRGEWSDIGTSHFRSFDFDALSNHFYAVYYLEKFEDFNGRNLLSGLLFFVPDEIWAGKVRDSGDTVTAAVAWEFRAGFPPNSAMPLVGDGVLAFDGVAGVLLIATVFAVALRLLDWAPRTRPASDSGLYPRVAVLVFTPVLLFFLSRGVLVGAFAYSSGNLLAAATAAWVITRIVKPGATEPARSPPHVMVRATPKRTPIGARWARGIGPSGAVAGPS